MSGERTPFSNGMLYGLATGLFGGSFWALILSLPPDEALIAPRWFLVGGGVLFWFLVGFVVGVFNSPKSANQTVPPNKSRFPLIQKMLVAIGWFLYRLLVGIFVGAIATTVALVVISLVFVGVRLFLDLENVPSDSPVIAAAAGSVMTGLFSGYSGAIFGALIGTRRFRSHRPAIGPRAVRGSFLSLLFGVCFGAALRLPPGRGTLIFVYFAVSIPIGILSGILGGIWTDVRSIRAGRNH